MESGETCESLPWEQSTNPGIVQYGIDNRPVGCKSTSSGIDSEKVLKEGKGEEEMGLDQIPRLDKY